MKPDPAPGKQGEAERRLRSATGVQHVSWNELYTPDIEASKAFYAKHFTSVQRQDADGPDGRLLVHRPRRPDDRCDDAEAAARADAGWNYYIRVGDIDSRSMR
jgi:predicted enzyme related to lactoylglutathione lyase